MQDYPILDSAISSRGQTTVTGRLTNTGTSGHTYTIQFFSSPAADPSGTGEGETYLGQTTATSNWGDASFSFTATSQVPLGYFVTATATSEGFGGPGTGDTSEFSKTVEVLPPILIFPRPSTNGSSTLSTGP